MPILDLQRRMRQLGEIRIGHVVPTKNGKTRPEKLNKFRFTSPSQAILTAVAEAYGGDVRPWTPANNGPQEFEVYTHTNRIPVVVPPLAVTQWYELYQGSKCVRRCDGQIEQKSDRSCLCDPERRDCSITTRLNVMLRDVPPIGHWLLTSRGYYAAVELPGIADLLARGGGNVPGWLSLEERRIVTDEVDKEGRPIVNRFIVPTLDIELSPAKVLAGDVGGAPAAVGGASEAKQLEGGKPDQDEVLAGYYTALAEATTTGECMEIFEQAKDTGHVGKEHPKTTKEQADALYAAIGDRARAISAQDEQGNGNGAEAEPDPDQVWQQIVAAAGSLPAPMTTPELHEDFARHSGGVTAGEASGAELASYLKHLQSLAGDEAKAAAS